jgi:hypothetical protein
MIKIDNMIGTYMYDHMIHFHRRNHIEENYRIYSIMKKNTQILIFEFEYLQSDSNTLGSDATG